MKLPFCETCQTIHSKDEACPSAPLNLCPPTGVTGTTLPDSPVRDAPISLPVHPVSSHLDSLPGFDGFERVTYQTLTKAQALVVLPKMRILEPLPKKGNAIIANTPGGEFPLVRVTLTPGRSTDGKSPLYALEFFRRVPASPVKDTPADKFSRGFCEECEHSPIAHGVNGECPAPASPVASVGAVPVTYRFVGTEELNSEILHITAEGSLVIGRITLREPFRSEMLGKLNSHAAKDAKIKALTEALENQAMFAADISCACQDIRKGLRDESLLIGLQDKAVRFNAAARAALALPCA